MTSVAIDARGLPWATELGRQADLLSRCEAVSGVFRVVRADGAERIAGRPLPCRCKVCPVCARARALRSLASWHPVVLAAAMAGAVSYQLTLTQRSDLTPGGLVTRAERAHGWTGTPYRPGDLGAPTGGESLLAAYERFRGALRELREDRATRETAYDALGGAVMGLEWTGRAPGGIPRWHVHAHLLVTHPADHVATGRRALSEFIGDWCRRTGARRACQVLQPIAPGQGRTLAEAVAAGVVECLKYPFKLSNLTEAQRVEVLATARGWRAHSAIGGWYKHPVAGLREPWATWYAERPPPPDARQLWWLRGGEHSAPERYLGQVTSGAQWWSWHPDGRDAWVERAERWAALAALPVDDPEPGSDLVDEIDGEAIL